jgi:D-arabinose 1-dehydrogenase-like Zn-dependent alcohol dehydrogenase
MEISLWDISVLRFIKKHKDVDFCGEHNITSDELINMQDINTAYERVTNNDVKYCSDMKSLKYSIKNSI